MKNTINAITSNLYTIDRTNRKRGHGAIIITATESGATYTVYREADARRIADAIANRNEEEAATIAASDEVKATRTKRSTNASVTNASEAKANRAEAKAASLAAKVEAMKTALAKAEEEAARAKTEAEEARKAADEAKAEADRKAKAKAEADAKKAEARKAREDAKKAKEEARNAKKAEAARAALIALGMTEEEARAIIDAKTDRAA